MKRVASSSGLKDAHYSHRASSEHREHRSASTKRSRSREAFNSSTTAHQRGLRARDSGAESGDERDEDEWSMSGFSSHRSNDSLSIAASDDYWIEENSFYYPHEDGEEAVDCGVSHPSSSREPTLAAESVAQLTSRRGNARGLDTHFVEPHHLDALAPEERALLAPPSKDELLKSKSRAFTPDDLERL